MAFAQSVSMQMPKAILMQMLLNGRNWSSTSPKCSLSLPPSHNHTPFQFQYILSAFQVGFPTRLLDAATFCHLHLTSADAKSPHSPSFFFSFSLTHCAPSDHKFCLFALLKHLNIFPFRIGQIFKICFRNK